MVVENRRPVGVDFSLWLAGPKLHANGWQTRMPAASTCSSSLESLVNAFCPGLAKTPYHIDRFAGGHHVHYARQTDGSA